MAVMMAMAAVATKDHVPQGQDTKQTQHFSFLRSVVSYVPVIRYGYRIKQRMSEKQDNSQDSQYLAAITALIHVKHCYTSSSVRF